MQAHDHCCRLHPSLQVTPGQEFVPDSSGATYRIVWGVDESGNLIAQEARPAGLQQHLQAAGSGQAMPIAVAENGRARLPMAGNVLLEVRYCSMHAYQAGADLLSSAWHWFLCISCRWQWVLHGS
jgi:hypothetical protein